MASLTDVYRHGRGRASRERLALGSALFVAGTLAVLCGIVVASTDLGAAVLSTFGARELAGVLGGVGAPAAALGVLTILPGAGRTVRIAGVAGTVGCLVGVLLFTGVYPWQWLAPAGGISTLALTVLATYLLGSLVVVWAVFSGIANFSTRNAPGGTVRLEVTREGRTKIVGVEGSRVRSALGGVGLLGSQPDGEVETQTNWVHPAERRRERAARRERQATDGGSTVHAEVTHTAPREPAEDSESRPKSDPYCGNCEQFRYVRTDDGLTPYCGYHEHLMDDMEPCEDWQSNAE